jgi:hypothetical protein
MGLGAEVTEVTKRERHYPNNTNTKVFLESF